MLLHPVSRPSICELWLPRASPSTHMHVDKGAGPTKKPQHVPSVETTAGKLCACMCGGRRAGGGEDMDVHPQHVCACTLGQPGMRVHTRCTSVQPL